MTLWPSGIDPPGEALLIGEFDRQAVALQRGPGQHRLLPVRYAQFSMAALGASELAPDPLVQAL